VKNGRTEISVNLDEFKKAGGKFPPLKFTESGWFVVRAVTDNTATYRYASTGPYYVEIGYQPRISRESAKFFLDWTNKRAEEIAIQTNDSPTILAAKKCIKQARAYWQQMLGKTTVE
jgi:hypothetical protein